MHRWCLRAYRCFVFYNSPYPPYLCVTYRQRSKLRTVSLSFPIYVDLKKWFVTMLSFSIFFRSIQSDSFYAMGILSIIF